MDQIQNRQLPEFLKHLLASPATASQTHRPQLEALVQSYPQCSIFHLLLARAAQNDEAAIAAKTLQSAAVHAANREILFRLIHQPEQITSPKPKAIYPFVEPAKGNGFLKPDAPFIEEKFVPAAAEITVLEENYPEKNPFAENADAPFTEENLVTELPLTEIHAATELSAEEAIAAENDLRVEDVSLTFINEPAEEIVFPMEEVIAPRLEEATFVHEAQTKTADTSFTQEIDEEVYEEITAIEDIRIEPVKPIVALEETVMPMEAEKPAEEASVFAVQDKAEKDMLSNIASIDYFTFNNRFGQNQVSPVTEEVEAATVELKADLPEIEELPAETEDLPVEKEQERVSKYHDEKMPYTFMWWLDKTRKEYAGTYQPYVKIPNAQKTESGLSVGPELHQQYIESIFHTKPPHGLEENGLTLAIEPAVKRKEDQLIERFIIQEPHIHPPSNDKLDTENKAKKSSEDADILVTETLAKIYLDQMLYHKALDTYKKLLLKFPEKSRYFTDQIDLIEKKIN